MRTSLSLPDDLLEDVTYVSSTLGITRSALVAEILQQAIPDFANMLRNCGLDNLSYGGMSEDTVNRLRGASADLVRTRINKLRDQVDGNDLFSPR